MTENRITRRLAWAACAAAFGMLCLCAGYYIGTRQPKGVFTVSGSVYEHIASPLSATPVPSAETVNINTATWEELQTLPDIGPKTADKIIAFREQYGPFIAAEDLMHVDGIGEVTVNKLRELITW